MQPTYPADELCHRARSASLVAMSTHGAGVDPHHDPEYRKQDHIIFMALALPIFAVTIFIIALVVTLGQR